MFVALLAACALHPAPRAEAAPVTVALRPGDPLPALGPEARVDRGLQAAAQELASEATQPSARLAPGAVRVALGRAGYPGDAHFLQALGGESPPADLLAAIPRGEPVDVGWAWRDVGGARWWVLGWAPRRVTMDPIPRDQRLDGGFALRVDGARAPRLLVGQPEGGVDELSLTSGLARWVSGFHVPGEYRIEVVDGDAVALLFSVYVDATPPVPSPLPGPAPIADPRAAEAWLRTQLDDLRRRAGVPPVVTFEPFVPLSRSHATCLGEEGVAVHQSSKCPGVTDLASRTFYPRARHHEDIAAADTAAEAWERLLDSPAHRLNLLCRECTHVAIGADLEVAERPRVFVVWELLAFPDGPPEPIAYPR